jgi:hypothetical protein
MKLTLPTTLFTSFGFHTDEKRRVTFVALFFGILALIGLLSFRDYGIPYDEGTLTELGMKSYEYVFEGKPYIESRDNRFHGTALELPLHTFLEWIGADTLTTLYVRRFVVFSFFFGTAIALYFLGKRFFRDWKIALLGCIFFALSPHVFAHGFYNSRDIPNMALFTIAMVTLLRLLEHRSFVQAIVHGIVCGLAIGIRMPSVLLIAFTLGFLALHAIIDSGSWKPKIRSFLLISACYLAALGMTLYTVWPLLWVHPVKHFIDAYAFMSSIKPPLTFFGTIYTDVPWFYIPAWIAITTPLLYTIFMLIGTVSVSVLLIRKHIHLLQTPDYSILIPLAWFFGPIIAIVVLRAGIYQEWRHVLFIYPAFILLSLHGIRTLEKFLQSYPSAICRLSMVALAVPLLSTSFWMLRNHPFENVYYAVKREWISPTLEMDYWGHSTRYAAEFIAKHDERRPISFYSPQNIALLNGRSFLVETYGNDVLPIKEPAYADYFVWLHSPENTDFPYQNNKELYSIVVDGMKLVSVYEGNLEGKAFMDDVRRGKN